MAEPFNPFDNPRNKRWFINLSSVLGLRPNELVGAAQRGENISFPSDIQSISDIQKRFSDQGIPVPEYLMELAAEEWEEYEELVLDDDILRTVGHQSRISGHQYRPDPYGPIIPDKLVQKTNELTNRGYVKIGDSIPHIDKGNETKFWKELWAKPKFGTDPVFGEGVNAAALLTGLMDAANKEASRRVEDKDNPRGLGNLVHPIHIGDVSLPHDGGDFWDAEFKSSWKHTRNLIGAIPQFATAKTAMDIVKPPEMTGIERIKSSWDQLEGMNPFARVGLTGLMTAMPALDAYESLTEQVAGLGATGFIPGINPSSAATDRYNLIKQLDPNNIQSPDYAKRIEAYKQSKEAGEISWDRQMFYELVGDPVAFSAGGEVASLLGMTGKPAIAAMSSKEIAKFGATMQAKHVVKHLGPSFNETNGILNVWKIQSAGSGSISSDFRAAFNLVAFDPSVNIDAFGPNSVAVRQQLMDSGVLEEQADLLTRVIGKMSVKVGDGNPDALAGQIQVSKISDAAANSALEQTIQLDNLDAPIGFTFKISEPDNTVTGLRHNFDSWMDLVDTIDPSSGYARKLTKAGFNSTDQTFSKNGLLDQLQGQNLLMPEGPEYGEFSGMRLHKEELVGLGIDSFIRNYRGDRIPMNELRQFMDQNRLKITEIKMEDLYSQGMYRARLGGAADHYGVIGLSLDLENMSPDSTIVRSMLQAEDDELTSYLGHYGLNYMRLANPGASEFVIQSVDNMAQRATELINPTGPSLTAIPNSYRANIMMTGRFQIRTTADGQKLFHIDEVQSDFFQNHARTLGDREFDTTFAHSLDNLSGPDTPLYWDVIDQNKKSGGWSMGRFGTYPEDIHLPDGTLYEAEADSIFITPTHGITVSDESVKVLYDNIIKSIGDNPKLSNKGRSSQKFQTSEGSWVEPIGNEENFGAKIIEEELYEVGQDFVRVQILKQGDEISQEGVEKAPIIRIANYKSQVSFDGRYDFYNLRNLRDFWNYTARGMLSFEAPSIVKRRAFNEDFWNQTRWSTDDILNNKTPYKVVKEGDGYAVYLGGARPNIPGLMNKRGISMGDYETREGAAKAINNYLRTIPTNTTAFNLPENFIFDELNYATPVIRRMLFNAAHEGAKVLTFSSAEELVNRYGKAALPYALRMYGRVMGEGVKPSGLMHRETRRIITDVMRTAGWSRWSVNDTNKLMARIEVPTGTRRIPYEAFENDTVKGGNSLGASTSVHGALNRLKFILGGEASAASTDIRRLGYEGAAVPVTNIDRARLAETQVKLINEMDSTIFDGLDHIPWELTINDADPVIRNAILERLVSADVGKMTERLFRKWESIRTGASATDPAKAEQLEDALSVLDHYTSAIERSLKPHGLGIDDKATKFISDMPEEAMPAVLKALRDRRGLNSSGERANYFNLLNMIEFEGIPVTPRAHGTSNDDILRILLEESIDTINPRNNMISKMKHPIHIAPRQTDKVTAFNGVRLTDDLSNPAVRKELGITTTPDSNSLFMPTLQEALTNVQMRLFQINDQAPKGGNVLGLVDFTNDGKYLVRLTEAADSHVAYHEVGHIFRRLLTENELRKAGEFSMGREVFDGLTNKNIWSREAEEVFADAFDSYLRTGFARNPEMRTIFERFKEWLKSVGRAIKGSPHEEKLSPEMRQFFDELLTSNRPSTRKIENSIPPHMIDEAKKFYGYRVADHNVANADGIDIIDRQFKVTDEIPISPPLEELSPLTSIEDTLSAAFVEDLYRKVGEGVGKVPLAGAVIKGMNPSAAASDPLARALIIREILIGQGGQKATIAISKLRRLGNRQKVFGDVDDKGLFSDGPLKGMHLNDIRTRPNDYPLSPEQREWIDVASTLEEAKLKMLEVEGIKINLLDFDEGGQYAGRRVFVKVDPDGRVIDAVAVGRGVGGKQAYQKTRVYKTAEEAVEDGFRYMEEDEALFMNLEAAYRQVADKRVVDYIVSNLNMRTAGTELDLIVNRNTTAERVDKAQLLIKELLRARRGDQIHWQTRKSIERSLDELTGMLDDVSRITLEDLVEAGRVAADQPTSIVPKKGLIRKLFERVKELEDEIKIIESNGEVPPASLIADLNTMKKKLGFQKHMVAEAYKNFYASPTGEFEYNFSRSVSGILAESRVGAIDELLAIVRGEPYQHKVGDKIYTRYKGGMLDDLRIESAKAAKALSDDTYKKRKASYTETSLGSKIPAFAGKIFLDDQPAFVGTKFDPQTFKYRQKTGQEVVNDITKSMVKNQEFYRFMEEANTINGAMRFFRLAGDMSWIGIHLFFLMGHATNPTGLIKSVLTGRALRGDFSQARNLTFLPKALVAFVHAFIDPTVHAKYLDEHAELLNRHPGVILAGRGTEFTEFTRKIGNAGFVRAKPIQVIGELAGTIPGTKLAGRGYVGFIKRSQTGFEAALDIAGIELTKMLDDLGTDAAKIGEVDAVVNEMRGLSDAQRLGVSAKQRQIESFTLLASRYNRAIGGMLADLPRGGIRGSQARRKVANGIAAASAISVAISLARGESMEEMLEHFNPQSPAFYTWNIGGVNIGFGTKVRSLIKLSAGMYTAMTDDRPTDWLSMENPALRFARGNASPIIGTALDVITGRTYMGEPSRDSIQSFGKNVLAPSAMFIWMSTMLLEGGSIKQRSLKGLSEFVGFRGYPETMTQVLHNYSKDTLGLDYDELEPFERKLLRDLMKDVLLPMQQEQLLRGSQFAKYYYERDLLDEERLDAEKDLLTQYMNPEKWTGKFLVGNPEQTFRDIYNDIQSAYAVAINDLNEQHHMYQDDQEFDEDNPKNYVLQEWYALFEKAYRTASTEDIPNSIYEGVFDTKKLVRLKQEFWASTLPNGERMIDYKDFVARNTTTTIHPPRVMQILGNEAQLKATQEAQQAFLKDRGKWNDVLDKSK